MSTMLHSTVSTSERVCVACQLGSVWEHLTLLSLAGNVMAVVALSA